jgi:hypothetical protein
MPDVLDPPGQNFNVQALSPAAQQVVAGLALLAKSGSIPLREPVYNRPSFWCYPLNEMRARLVSPVATNGGWQDIILLNGGMGRWPSGYGLKVQYYIATQQNDPATSGVLYRFIKNGSPLNSLSFNITNAIDKNVERLATPNPWPAMPARFDIVCMNGEQLRMQVFVPTGAAQRCFACLYGYYFPNLGSLTKGNLETGHLNEDAGRDIGQGTDKP